MSEDSCPLCAPESTRIFYAGQLILGLWDAFPVSPGHALLVTRRHIPTWFDATDEEHAELVSGIGIARREIERTHRPDGYNLGVNVGRAAGQTVFHLHLHVIPRYNGDVANPLGGVRHVVPAKADYLAAPAGAGWVVADRDVEPDYAGHSGLDAPHRRPLITGAEDPLLPHLRAHLDTAHTADFAVAFVLESGVRLLEGHLADLLARGGRFRLVTGDYLGVTEPNALIRLLDLHEEYPAGIQLRVFEAGDGTFHPKSYVFVDDLGEGVALVGSSNLTRPALLAGVEWNFRTITSRDRGGFADVVAGFEVLFRHPKTRPLDAEWIERYRARRPVLRTVPEREIAAGEEPPAPPPEPHAIQKRALEALEATRVAGNLAGLVVLATGLGKTWLAAFDSHRPEFRRILFVAHREEILRQALATFRRIRPDARLGLYSGQEKSPEADVLFASIQTLGLRVHLQRFITDEFDYVIVDEFHHAAASTYRRVIDHFEPKFLLGLTATPERTDGGDLLSLCRENLVFRCDLAEGINAGLLSPFHYYGVPDEVDYANIPWRSSRFDTEALTRAVATRSRAQNALDQYRKRGGTRTLAFCCSTLHADFMRDFFHERGVRAVAVHSERTSDPRARSLERLEAGEIDVVFAVDMFNEGVDLPDVDTIMMLRPTESRIVWLQQFGRGLRKAEGKDRLTVIDYIGNHRAFLLKPQTLFELPPGDSAIHDALNLLQRGEATLSPGCEVTYELEAINILRSLLRRPGGDDVMRFEYEDFRQRNGRRPTASEMYHEGYNARALRKGYGSWFGFVDAMNNLDPNAQVLIHGGRAAEFLASLEITPMTRSYKMLVLLAMLHADRFPGNVSIDDLCTGVQRLARPSALLQKDLGIPLDDTVALRELLLKNPVDAWAGAKGTGGTPYFAYGNGRFRTTFEIEATRRDAFGEMVRELAEWRLAEYLDRPAVTGSDGQRFLCKVSHAGDRPMLFLPPRDGNPAIPTGWTPVTVDGAALEADFVKVAVNVVRRPGDEGNLLPSILRRWFGENAGVPGTSHQVVFESRDGTLEMFPLPVGKGDGGPQVGKRYMRTEIPAMFNLKFSTSIWQQGFVFEEGKIFLLVTLDKEGMPQQHRYGDRFLGHELFEWKSQNRHNQSSAAGQAIRAHAARGIPVHLFVRKQGKVGTKAAPFVYCGEVDFVDWEGNQPITVRWHLREPISDEVARLFGVDDIR